MRRKDFLLARKRMQRKMIDGLIDLLASGDLQTRFLAEMCLRDKTST